jgi:hypothetical protein
VKNALSWSLEVGGAGHESSLVMACQERLYTFAAGASRITISYPSCLIIYYLELFLSFSHQKYKISRQPLMMTLTPASQPVSQPTS